MYIVNASASVLQVSFALTHKSTFSSGLGALCNFCLSHGVLLLGSVIHHVPTTAPHNFLLMYMRLVLFFQTIQAWLEVRLGILDAMAMSNASCTVQHVTTVSC